MKRVLQIDIAAAVFCFVFVSFYILQNLDQNARYQISIVDKQTLEYPMICLVNGFYSIQKSDTDFKEMWDHYIEVIEVSKIPESNFGRL